MANIKPNIRKINHHYYAHFTLLITFLAFCVIVLGAYTRLSNAGLSCPDWPACYGQLTVPHTQAAIQQAEHAFPGHILQAQKAWKEMVHRYFAGSLGLLIFLFAIWSWVRLRQNQNFYQPQEQSIFVPLLLVALVIFQDVLGKWTVTWQLLPLAVMSHLLVGMFILALLWWSTLKHYQAFEQQRMTAPSLRPWAILGLAIVAGQIFLGGWTSSNYAALICPQFPFCHGELFPQINFRQAFNLFHPIGANYDGGVLDTIARVTIQMVHRYGAMITAVYLCLFAVILMRTRPALGLRPLAWLILLLLSLQVTLGVLNVEWLLPLWIAVAHNAVAGLLLLTLVTVLYKLFNDNKSRVSNGYFHIKG